MDRDFDAKIGRFRGGLQLMAAFGFVDPSTAAAATTMTSTPGRLTLRNTPAPRKNTGQEGLGGLGGLSVSYLSGLNNALRELKQHMESTEYPEMANNHAVASAMEVGRY